VLTHSRQAEQEARVVIQPAQDGDLLLIQNGKPKLRTDSQPNW